MPRKKVEEPTYEELDQPSRAPRIIAMVGFYLFAGFFLFTLFVGEESPFVGVQHVLKGLGGVLAFLIPAFFAWAATLILFTLLDKRLSAVRCICTGLIFPCIHGLLHVFYVESILKNYMTLPTFANHIAQSYKYEAGGGAIGALSAWFLQRKLGTALAFVILLAVLLLLLLGTGKIKALIDRLPKRSEDEDDFDAYEDERQVEIIEPEEKPRRNKKTEAVRNSERPLNADAPRKSRRKPVEDESLRKNEETDAYDETPGYTSVRGRNLDANRKSSRIQSEPDAPKHSPRRGQLYNERIENPNYKRKKVDRGEKYDDVYDVVETDSRSDSRRKAAESDFRSERNAASAAPATITTPVPNAVPNPIPMPVLCGMLLTATIPAPRGMLLTTTIPVPRGTPIPTMIPVPRGMLPTTTIPALRGMLLTTTMPVLREMPTMAIPVPVSAQRMNTFPAQDAIRTANTARVRAAA